MAARKKPAPTPGVVFARRLKEVRGKLQLHQQDVAERLQALGYPMNRVTVAKIEGGGEQDARPDNLTRARNVSLVDVLSISAALGVSPTMMFTTRNPDTPIAVTPKLHASAEQVRSWARGEQPLDDQDRRVYTEEVGDEEWEVLRHPATRAVDFLRMLLGLALDGRTPPDQLGVLLTDIEREGRLVQEELARCLADLAKKARS